MNDHVWTNEKRGEPRRGANLIHTLQFSLATSIHNTGNAARGLHARIALYLCLLDVSALHRSMDVGTFL